MCISYKSYIKLLSSNSEESPACAQAVPCFLGVAFVVAEVVGEGEYLYLLGKGAEGFAVEV